MEISSLKNLPELERPREKAIHYGIDKLSNAELLALLIGSGTKSKSCLVIANEILSKKGINEILSLNFNDLLKIKGISTATAFRFVAINEIIRRQGLLKENDVYIKSRDLAIRYQKIIGRNINETMYFIGINKNSEIVMEKQLYLGTINKLISSENEIIKGCLVHNLNYFVIIHNHPSKEAFPSNDDLISTNHLLIKARQRKIVLLDHIIVTSNDYYSFMEHSDFFK